MPTSKVPNFKVKYWKVPILSIFRHNQKVPIVKYYTAQVCLAQGIAVLQDQMAEIPLVNFLGLKIVSIESYSSYIIIWETLKSLAYSTLLKSTSLKNIFNCLCQTVINYRLTRTTRLKRKLICKCIKFLQFDNGIWITLPSFLHSNSFVKIA